MGNDIIISEGFITDIMTGLTKHQAIVLDLVEKLKDISIANGYLTEFGNIVEHWNSEVQPEENAELINVRDYSAEVDNNDDNNDITNCKIEVKISLGCCKQGFTWKYLTDGIADVKKLIRTNLYYFHDKYSEILFGLKEFGVDGIDEVPITIGESHVTITIEYIENAWLEDETTYNVEVTA